MKLNFWQWLGIILLVLGAIGYMLYKKEHAAPTAPPAPAASTVPSAPASTNPSTAP
jgi:hypothetical protein